MREAEFRSLVCGGILTSLRCYEVRIDDSDLAIHCEVRVLGLDGRLGGVCHRLRKDRGRHVCERRDPDRHNRHYSAGHASDVEERRTGK